MGKINWGRVILGGLVAGVVINILEFVLHGVLLRSDWEAAMTALGKSMQAGGAASMVYYNLGGFVAGLAGAWLYAGIRPRYGAGPGTAAKAGLGAWVLGCLGPTLIMMGFGLFNTKLYWFPAIADLVVYQVALQVAGALYQET